MINEYEFSQQTPFYLVWKLQTHFCFVDSRNNICIVLHLNVHLNVLYTLLLILSYLQRDLLF